MTYQPNIPRATDLIKNSQPDIQGNFQGIKTLIDVNHETFDLTDQGKHTLVTLTSQSAVPTTGSTEINIYNKVPTSGSLTGIQELWLRKSFNNGADVRNVPMTGSVLSISNPNNQTAGWTELPSGVVLKWGYGATDLIGDTTVLFATSNPPPAVVFNKCLTVIVTTLNGSAFTGPLNVRSGSMTNLQFKCFFDNFTVSSVNFTYLAIGW